MTVSAASPTAAPAIADGGTPPPRRLPIAALAVHVPKLAPVAALALFALALTAGLLGIDFGFHWDEPRLLNAARRMVKNGDILARWYNYPSVSHDLAVLGAKLLGVWSALTSGLTGEALLVSPRFQYFVRGLFCTVSLSGIVAVYLASRAAGRDRGEALLAAALVAGSFELHYHSRWIAPDAVMASLAAWSLVPASRALSSRRPAASWLLALALAGLATATKYPAGLLVVVLLVSAATARLGPGSLPRAALLRLGFVVALGLVAVACFVIATPGALFDTQKFFDDIKHERLHYKERSHEGHTVEPGLGHAAKLLTYLVMVAPSPFWPLALVLAAAAVYGAVRVALVGATRPAEPPPLPRRQRLRLALLLVGFPAAYFAFFISQKVMIVRNVLVLVPFGALLASRGLADAASRLPWPKLRAALGPVLAVLIGALHAVDQIGAGRDIQRDPKRLWAEVKPYLEAQTRAKRSFLLSARASVALAKAPTAYTYEPSAWPDAYVFMAREYRRGAAREWEANRWRHAERIFGSREVNLDYYPMWWGRDRVVVMSWSRATRVFVLPHPPPGRAR